jgi:ribonuclease J
MSALQITVYGGAAGEGADGEIGGNRILVEWDDRAWFLDFGLRFKAHGRYYEEFLKPRGGTLGLRDYLRMDLLPPLEGLYREDLQTHEPDLWERYRDHPAYARLDHVDGVLVSHAHLDHNGCIGFLRPEIPVFTGLTTAITGKAMQDLRGIGAENEYCYIAPREATDDGRLRSSKLPRVQRRHVVCEDVKLDDRLQDFWCGVPGPKTLMDSCPLETWEQDGATHGLRFWRGDHSIPGSGSFGISTPDGWVIYTGDVRRHGHSHARVDKFIEEASALKPSVLVVEGTRVDEQTSTTEQTVHDATDGVVARTDGLVVADFSPRNIERLRTFHDIAVARSRRLAVTVQDAYLLERLHLVDPAIPTPGEGPIVVLREVMGTEPPWMRELYDRYESSVVGAADVRRDLGGFILCLSYWDISNLVDIEPAGGTYIYSASEAYTEEQAIDQRRLVNWLDHFGLERVGGLPGAEEGPFHASGHADGPSLQALIETIAPYRILPVHTESLDWFQKRWPGKVMVAAYGERVRL